MGTLGPVSQLMFKNKKGDPPQSLSPFCCLSLTALPLHSPSALSLGGTHQSCGHHCASGRHLRLRYALHCDVQKETARYLSLCRVLSSPPSSLWQVKGGCQRRGSLGSPGSSRRGLGHLRRPCQLLAYLSSQNPNIWLLISRTWQWTGI